MTTAAPSVTGVDFVSVPTQDLDRATDFYANVVGLERGPVWGRTTVDAVGAEFETGTVTIALIVCEGLGIEFSPHRVPIALHVDDVAAARADSSRVASSSWARRSTRASAIRRSSATPTGTCSTCTTATRLRRPRLSVRHKSGTRTVQRRHTLRATIVV